MRADDEQLRSENDRRRKDGNGAMFLEKSDFDGLHRLKFPKLIVWLVEQQFAVKGLQGFEFETFIIVWFERGWPEEEEVING